MVPPVCLPILMVAVAPIRCGAIEGGDQRRIEDGDQRLIEGGISV